MTVFYGYLLKLIETAEGRVMYVLTAICVAMIIDFLSGTAAARMNPDIEFRSKIGINGIIRKVASVVLLMFFILIAPLIPGGMGLALLYTLYLGYLVMEIKSIFENYEKMGLETGTLKEFVEKLTQGKSNDGDQS
ncbi:phage holin family protein [Enterococcus olivae]